MSLDESATERTIRAGGSAPRRTTGWWPWLPLAIAVVWAIAFLVTLRSDVQGIYTNSDVVSAPFIGQLYSGAGPGAQVTLGNILWFPALVFELITKGLPAHRQVWELAPYALSLIGIWLVAWSTGRAGGRWAAAMVAVGLAVASPYLLVQQFGWSIHSLTYVEVAALGAYLTLCVRHDGIIGGPVSHALLGVVAAAVVALGLASDELFAFAGLLPFLVAGLWVAWAMGLRAAQLAATVIAVVVVGAVGAAVLHHVVIDHRIVAAHFPITFTADNTILSHLGLVVQGGFDLFDGDFGGQRLTPVSVLAFLCAVVVMIAIAVGLKLAWSWVREQGRRLPARGGGASERDAHLTYWSLVAALTTLGYVFSSVAIPGTARYLVPAAYGLVAVLVVRGAGVGAGRAAIVLGLSVLTISNAVAFIRHVPRPADAIAPNGALADRLARFARSEGLTRGYAGYWDAAPLSWGSRSAIDVYPVQACGSQLCPFGFHRISSWYVPHPGQRSYLVSDPTQPVNPTPPASLGPPLQTVHIGQLTVYVYRYDIASRFG